MVLDQVKGGKGAYGYNAGTGEYGDMIDAGVLDPAKVTRLALRNAASVAGLLLSDGSRDRGSFEEKMTRARRSKGGGMGGMGRMHGAATHVTAGRAASSR